MYLRGCNDAGQRPRPSEHLVDKFGDEGYTAILNITAILFLTIDWVPGCDVIPALATECRPPLDPFLVEGIPSQLVPQKLFDFSGTGPPRNYLCSLRSARQCSYAPLTCTQRPSVTAIRTYYTPLTSPTHFQSTRRRRPPFSSCARSMSTHREVASARREKKNL